MRLTLGGLWGCLEEPDYRTWGKVLEKSAEAIVVPTGRDEGPNRLLQGASREDSMGIERRQGTVYQLSLLEGRKETMRPGVPGEGGTGTGASEEEQGPTASERLLSLVDQPAGVEARGAATIEAGKPALKYLRVVVEDGDGPQSERVNIRVPMGLIRAGVRLASVLPSDATSKINEKLQEQGIPIDLGKIKAEDLEDLVNSLNDLQVNVQDGNEKVRIYVE